MLGICIFPYYLSQVKTENAFITSQLLNKLNIRDALPLFDRIQHLTVANKIPEKSNLTSRGELFPGAD